MRRGVCDSPSRSGSSPAQRIMMRNAASTSCSLGMRMSSAIFNGTKFIGLLLVGRGMMPTRPCGGRADRRFDLNALINWRAATGQRR